MNKIEHNLVIPETLAGKRLDQALAKMLPQYSRERLKDWIKQGFVTVDDAIIRPKDKVSAEQNIIIRAELTETTLAAQPIDLNIVFEDDDILVLNKPAGLVVHPGAGNPDKTLLNALLHYAPELKTLPRAGIIHRLDKDTTGLMVVTKSLEAHTKLVADMQARHIERIYHAILIGELTCSGTVDQPIGRHPRQRTKMAVVKSGKPALTHYELLQRFTGFTYLKVRLESGRTHQIRVHMAHIKHPVLGDSTYGGTQRIKRSLLSDECLTAIDALGRQALHAIELKFNHPISGKPMTFEAPLPTDILNILAAMTKENT